MGVDPFDALVLPRFLALLITIPLLTFVATLAGLVGGMVVVWIGAGPRPDASSSSGSSTTSASTQFWVGMSKAPVMAVVIAGIGCRQGMEVGGDVEVAGPAGDRGGGARHLRRSS